MAASGQQLQQPTAYDAQAEAQRMQQEATQLLSTALATISSQCQSPLLQAGGADHQVVSAVMAPIVLQLAESNRTVRRANAWMSNAAHSMDQSEVFKLSLQWLWLRRVSSCMAWLAIRQPLQEPG